VIQYRAIITRKYNRSHQLSGTVKPLNVTTDAPQPTTLNNLLTVGNDRSCEQMVNRPLEPIEENEESSDSLSSRRSEVEALRQVSSLMRIENNDVSLEEERKTQKVGELLGPKMIPEWTQAEKEMDEGNNWERGDSDFPRWNVGLDAELLNEIGEVGPMGNHLPPIETLASAARDPAYVSNDLNS